MNSARLLANARPALVAPVLYAGEDASAVRALIALPGTLWCREALTWPPDEPFASASLRVPRDRPSLVMSVHALAARLPAQAPLLLYGPNDEGIKSAPKALAPFFAEIGLHAARGHGRLWIARRTGLGEGLKGSLKAWRETTTVTFDGRARPWVSYPGVFARGSLDPGTALLLTHLPTLAGQRALDVGAGSGIIARSLVDRGARVTLVEPDALAFAAARENVPEAEAFHGRDLPPGPFDLIASNPPIHHGKVRDLGVLQALLAAAPGHLAATGALLIVTQETVPIARLAGPAFPAVDCVAEGQGYRVWRLARSARLTVSV